MSENLTELSEQELADLIANAAKQLEHKRGSKKREVVNQIRELAASIGVQVEITDSAPRSSRAGSKVAIKYRDPANPKNAWTGRGMKPRWLKNYLDSGREIDSFLI